jgi:hypothetical protein
MPTLLKIKVNELLANAQVNLNRSTFYFVQPQKDIQTFVENSESK